MALKDDVEKLSGKYIDRVAAIRRDLHRHPEAGMKEIRTAAIAANALEKAGIETRRGVCGTGVVGLIHGASPGAGRTLLLRADMDALPVTEESGVSYASETPGLMHACGHDGHTANLIGASLILNELRDKFPGTVMILFQPSEEYPITIDGKTMSGGAEYLIENGILENPRVDCAMAMHLWGGFPKGKIAVRKNEMMASPGRFEITIKGRGGHGSAPQKTSDPVAMAAAAINGITMALDRALSPFDRAVVSWCSIHAGQAYNIIPDKIDMVGTIRTFNTKTAALICDRMRGVLDGVTTANGGGYTFLYDDCGLPPLVNDPEMTEMLIGSAREMIGGENVIEMENPDMGSEDFSLFAREVPSVFYFVGVAEDGKPEPINHSPNFAWDDGVLLASTQVMSMAALNILRSK